MTWLFPALAYLISRGNLNPESTQSRLELVSKGFLKPLLGSSVGPLKVAILIPVHNQEAALSATLESVRRACKYALKFFPDLIFEVRVGLDGCNDRSLQFARLFDAEIFEFKQRQGKWLTLGALVHASADADWMVLCDAGAVWPENFFDRCGETLARDDVAAIAPSYKNAQAGVLEQLAWKLEAHLKKIESESGGPVSVHGATVLYRAKALLQVFDHLSSDRASAISWLNDDVVIPLTVRCLDSNCRIVYLSDLIVEEAKLGPALEGLRSYARRRRMVVGNLQWIIKLLPQAFSTNPLAALLALRRVFRVLWGYWLLALTVGAFMSAGPANSVAVIALVILSLVFMVLTSERLALSLASMADAFYASVLAPFMLKRLSSGGSWR